MNGCAYNDEIKVGEYVRTDKGYIFTVDAERKVLSGLKFLDVQYGNIVKHDFDIKKIVEGFEFIIQRHNESSNKIVNHRKDIIDLIEVGDYVNEKRVIYVDTIEDGDGNKRLCVFVEETQDCIEAEDIKSIVTKEHFNSVKYEVGD